MARHTMTQLVNSAVASRTVKFAAQCGIFFDGDMRAVIDCLTDAGHHTQQCDGERVLVDHKAWVTRHGVVHPIIN